MSERFRVDPNAPAVSNPQLRRLVELARRAPAPRSSVSLDSLRRQIAARGRGFRTGVAAGVVLAGAAAAALWIGAAPRQVEALSVDDTIAQPVRSHAYAPFVAPRVELSDVVHVTWNGGEPPRALAPWRLALGEGHYAVDVGAHAEQPLAIDFAHRTLELSEGQVDIVVENGVPVVTLRTGVAAWVDADGTRTTLVIETTVASQDAVPMALPAPNANELARAAERQLADGQRRAAILSLRTLVLRHPRSTAARSALLDLGRELEKEGMLEHARCAYRLYVARWPEAALRADVERSLARLGDGACDGLDPG